RQLVADVPVGTFLSGGLDSSLLTALSAEAYRRAGKGRLTTFSVDYIDNDLTVRICNDHCALNRRIISIADVDRNTCLMYGEYSVLMEYSCTHIRKFTKLFICDNINRMNIRNDTGIGNEKSVYICPILIKISIYTPCNKRTGDIRTAS
ncbi:MAG: hypothetical protein II306_04855, partial [Clostridia bacterium]|nr:hypothetical protein [Clostridia bacterium]